MAGMTKHNRRAQKWQNKPSFREVLTEVYGDSVSAQEAADAQFALTEFFKLLDVMDREQRAQEQGGCHD